MLPPLPPLPLLPRIIASRPVDFIAARIALGEAVPSVWRVCVARVALADWIPGGGVLDGRMELERSMVYRVRCLLRFRRRRCMLRSGGGGRMLFQMEREVGSLLF